MKKAAQQYYNLITKASLLWAFRIIVVCSYAQSPYNLVPNYSFEQHYNCGSSGAGGANGWVSPTTLSYAQYSYSNSCSSNICCGVPIDTYGQGWQYPRTGNGMVCFWFAYNDGKNTRVYIQTNLIDTMRNNNCYYIEFYINLFNNAKYANNNLT